MENLSQTKEQKLINEMCRYIETYRDKRDPALINKIAKSLGLTSSDVAGAIRKKSNEQFNLIADIYTEYRKIESENDFETTVDDEEQKLDLMIDEIISYIQSDDEAYEKIGNITGYYAFDIMGALNNPTRKPEVLENIYTACLIIKQQEMTNHSLETNTSSEPKVKKAQEADADKIQCIKDFIKVNPTRIFDLAKTSGISPQNIMGINSDMPDAEQVDKIYSAMVDMSISSRVEFSVKR